MSGRKADDLARSRKSESFIEGGRLRVECVDIDPDAASVLGEPLGFRHNPTSEAAPAL